MLWWAHQCDPRCRVETTRINRYDTNVSQSACFIQDGARWRAKSGSDAASRLELPKVWASQLVPSNPMYQMHPSSWMALIAALSCDIVLCHEPYVYNDVLTFLCSGLGTLLHAICSCSRINSFTKTKTKVITREFAWKFKMGRHIETNRHSTSNLFSNSNSIWLIDKMCGFEEFP